MTTAYDELVDFVAAGTTPETLVQFRPSDAAKAKVAELIARQKGGSLSSEESAELQHYLEIEHFMRLAKARAHQHIAVE